MYGLSVPYQNPAGVSLPFAKAGARAPSQSSTRPAARIAVRTAAAPFVRAPTLPGSWLPDAREVDHRPDVWRVDHRERRGGVVNDCDQIACVERQDHITAGLAGGGLDRDLGAGI